MVILIYSIQYSYVNITSLFFRSVAVVLSALCVISALYSLIATVRSDDVISGQCLANVHNDAVTNVLVEIGSILIGPVPLLILTILNMLIVYKLQRRSKVN